MPTPVKSHQPLLEDIARTETGGGQAAFWWLGQHSFILKLAGKVIYIDPYFDPNPARQTPPLLTYNELTNADLVLVTHDHGDHLCPESLRAISCHSRDTYFVTPST